MTAKLIRRLAPVLLLVGGAIGQTQNNTSKQEQAASQQSASLPKPKATISGNVIDAVTGKPLKKVWIVARKLQDRQAPYGAVTNAEGNFTIKDLDAGRYTLSATRTGYVSQQYGQRTGGRGGMPLNAESGGEFKDIKFKLQPGGVIYGRMVDEDGEPVSNVQMMLMRYAYVEGEKRLSPAQGARTDDRGEYRIFGLPTGKYYLSASVRGMFGGEAVTGTGPAEEGYAPIFYPGVTDLAQAQAIEVKAGNEERADLTFTPTRTYRVRGRLMDGKTGEPAKNANLSLMRKGQFFGFGFMGGFTAQVSPTDGKFEIRGVPPGSYTLTAFQWLGDGEGTSARLDVEVGDTDVDNVSMTTQPGRTFSGTLRLEGTPPADFKLTSLNVWLQSPQGPSMYMGPSRGAVKEDGTFQVKNLVEEDYAVRVSGLGPDMYVKSSKVGGDDVRETGFNPAKAKGNSLDIVVSTNAAQLDGVVTQDGNPFGGARVVLVPEHTGRGKPEPARAGISDQQGKFVLRGIRPGKYRLYAFEDFEPGAQDDPEYMKRFRNEGESIEFSEGGRATRTLKAIPAGTEQ